jgi:hypothetical protein
MEQTFIRHISFIFLICTSLSQTVVEGHKLIKFLLVVKEFFNLTAVQLFKATGVHSSNQRGGG